MILSNVMSLSFALMSVEWMTVYARLVRGRDEVAKLLSVLLSYGGGRGWW